MQKREVNDERECIEVSDMITRFNNKYIVLTYYFFRDSKIQNILIAIYNKNNKKNNNRRAISIQFIDNEESRIEFLCNYFNIDKKLFYKFFKKIGEII